MKIHHYFSHRKPHQLRDHTFDFAVRVVRLHQYLTEQRKEFVLSKQILRSGTNPGAMVREAIFAESGLDFIHKLGVAQKEMSETQYWLELLFTSGFLQEKEFASIYADSEEIMRQLKSSILTRKRNLALKSSMFLLTLISLI